MHAMSPMSNGSGSNTPVQVAPIVPSMVPVTQKPAIRHSTPLDTLNSLRSQKSSLASAITQSTDSSTITEVKALKAQSRAAQIEIARLRTQNKQLENQNKQFEDRNNQLAEQVKQLEVLPAQVAALKKVVDQRESAAAQGPSSEEIERRLAALENPKPAIEATQLAQLQSDVQVIKMDLETITSLREQLEQLQSTATQHGTDIGNAIATSAQLKTDVGGLASLRNEIRAVREQRQAMKGDAVKTMIQAALQPEIKKLETWRSQNDKALKGISTTVEANQKFCSELSTRDLPGELQTLQKRVNKVENNENKTEKRTTTLEETVKNLREDGDDLNNDIKRYIGPMKQAYETTKGNALVRIEDLEDESRLLRKDQDILRNEQKQLLEKLSKLPDRTDKPPSTSTDPTGLAQVVSSNGRNIEKLTKDVNEMKALTKELQQQSNRAHSAQRVDEALSHEHMKLAERVKKLETMPKRPASPAPATGSVQLKKSVDNLEDCVSQHDFRELWTHVRGETGLDTIIDGLQDDVEKMGQDVHAHGVDLALLQKDFSAIFADKFDPFKASVEKQWQAYSQTFMELSESLSKLQDQVTKSKSEKVETPTTSQLQSLNVLLRDMVTVKEQQTSITADLHRQHTDIEGLKDQVALKQDTSAATQAVDAVKAAIRSLQNQYDNISTDDLHQKMVNWFLHAYPNNAANMVQQFGVIQHEIGQLRRFTDQISRIPNGTQTLSALAQIGPQLIALAQSTPGSRDSAKGPGGSKEEFESLGQALAQTQQRSEGLAQTVVSLQTFMQSLNSDKAPFAKAGSLVELQESMRELQEMERLARNEFRNKAGQEHDQRVKAEEKITLEIKNLVAKVDDDKKERIEAEQDIVSTSNQRFTEFAADTTAKIKATADQLTSLHGAMNKIRAGVNEALTDTNKEFLNRLPILFVVAAELQSYLEDLNMNLPKGPLEFDWTANLNDELFTAPAPLSDEGHNTVRKGKSKQ